MFHESWRCLCIGLLLFLTAAPHFSRDALPASCTGYVLNVVHTPSSRIACVYFLAARQAFAQGGASQEQRDRLLQTTDRLDGQSRRLEDSKRTMMEIEDTGEKTCERQRDRERACEREKRERRERKSWLRGWVCVEREEDIFYCDFDKRVENEIGRFLN